MKRKQKTRAKKIRVQKPPVKKEQVDVPPPAIEAPSTSPHFHYGLTQHFTITVKEPDDERCARMVQVIVSHPEILEAVCELEVFLAMEASCGGYIDERYGDGEYYIGHVLDRFLDHFTEEDQLYLRQWGHEYESISWLGDCFGSEPSGFVVHQYMCKQQKEE